MNLIILGPPGSGKGTLSKLISDQFNLVHISTGDIFRLNIRQGTPLGKLASSYIEKGDLVPDQVTISMMEDALKQIAPDQGFLLDGFPRTVEQAEALEEILKKIARKLDAVINVVLPDEIIVHRLEGRRICKDCGASYNVDLIPPKTENVCDRCDGSLYQRHDDEADVVKNRLVNYHVLTKPLVEYYTNVNLLFDVDNSGQVEDTASYLYERMTKVKE